MIISVMALNKWHSVWYKNNCMLNLCMYLYIHVYVYPCIYTYGPMHISYYPLTICVLVCICTYTHTCTHTGISQYSWVYILVCIYIYTCIYTRIYMVNILHLIRFTYICKIYLNAIESTVFQSLYDVQKEHETLIIGFSFSNKLLSKFTNISSSNFLNLILFQSHTRI